MIECLEWSDRPVSKNYEAQLLSMCLSAMIGKAFSDSLVTEDVDGILSLSDAQFQMRWSELEAACFDRLRTSWSERTFFADWRESRLEQVMESFKRRWQELGVVLETAKSSGTLKRFITHMR